MKTREKKIIFVLLLALLFFETAVAVFDWSLLSGIFWALTVVVGFYPQKTFAWFFPLAVGLAVLIVLAVAFSQNSLASHLALTLFYFLVLLTESLIIRFGKEDDKD